ncbi:MAG: acyl-CoA dehydrogenase family protein [Ilumatobacter sp.]|nr:acyl-CoA dehydrogenase family protein [Ilumatobacter sp.]
MERTHFDEDHHLFREGFRQYVATEVTPNNTEWEAAGICDRSMFTTAGAAGYIGTQIPEEFGGGGVDDYRFNQVMVEEFEYAGVGSAGSGIGLHNDIVVPYFLEYCNAEQKQRWLPGLASGELISGIAMSEPGVGSDVGNVATSAVLDGDEYIVNGSKTFISNGILADVVVVALRTGPDRHRGVTLLVIERDTPGFERGRNLDKIGRHSQDTAELSFMDCRVPVANRLGEENKGFYYMMFNLAQERLNIAVSAIAAARYSFDLTLNYVKEREAFGQPVGSFQSNRFAMAEMATEIEIGQAFVDRCVAAHVKKELTADEAAMAKWWTTELQKRVNDECLQMHGGYGYMDEYEISRAWRDGRVQTIYGGTTAIMKEIVGRSLGL